MYKQFLVKSLPLPSEICNEISSYLFYDRETSTNRKKLQDSIHMISTLPRRNDREDWAFRLHNKYFAGINCRFCGNYIMAHCTITTPGIFCFCMRGLESYEEDYVYDIVDTYIE